jgi:hypothetical protein
MIVALHPDQPAEYYTSIKELFGDTQKLEEKEGRFGFFGGLIIVCFVFSLLPIIPWILSIVLPRLFRPENISVLGYGFSPGSFWFLWPTCFITFLVLLITLMVTRGPSEEMRSRRLSPVQMRFAYCYGTVDEIKKYQTNRLYRHIEKAQSYLDRLARSLWDLTVPASILGLPEARIHYRHLYLHEAELARTGAPAGRILGGLTPRVKWFKLDPQTEKILNAIFKLPSKFDDRLKDKRDLSTLARALTELATHLYTEIPEIFEGTEDDRRQWEETGNTALNTFADQVNALSPYRAEAKAVSPHETVSRQVVSTGWKLTSFFVHENVLVCFVAWYLLSLLLIGSGFWIAFHYVPTLAVDTVIMSTIVGGPVAGAITAVTIARIGRPRPSSTERESQ